MRSRIAASCILALALITPVAPTSAFQSPMMECLDVDDVNPHDGLNLPVAPYCQTIEEDAPFPTGGLPPESWLTDTFVRLLNAPHVIDFSVGVIL